MLGKLFQSYKREQKNRVNWVSEHHTDLKRIGAVFNTISTYILVLLSFFLMGDLITFMFLLLPE